MPLLEHNTQPNTEDVQQRVRIYLFPHADSTACNVATIKVLLFVTHFEQCDKLARLQNGDFKNSKGLTREQPFRYKRRTFSPLLSLGILLEGCLLVRVQYSAYKEGFTRSKAEADFA